MRDFVETEPRVRIEVRLDEEDRRSALHDETFWGLRAEPKELSPVWLYDERGSRLFERITRLPEYYPTRSERKILGRCAAEVAARTGAATLIELGSGTSEKTRLLLDALQAAGTLGCFVPLDASEDVLLRSARTVAERYPALRVHAIVGDFERHLGALPEGRRRLVAFLGSTIGNLHPERRGRFLAALAAVLGPGDALLLGVDLVKDPGVIEAAYNDPGGVTEEFVRNALTALNRDLHADFAQRRFAYQACWDPAREWVDIALRALEGHAVRVEELEADVVFAAGERLRIEVSAKFRRESLERELAAAGMRLEEWWTDADGSFALLLARVGRGRALD